MKTERDVLGLEFEVEGAMIKHAEIGGDTHRTLKKKNLHTRSKYTIIESIMFV